MSKVVVGIRCDGNSRIGLGHLRRCYTVADQLDRLDAGIVFIHSCTDPDNFIIKNSSYSHIFINDGLSQEDDAATTFSELAKIGCTKILLDSYEIGVVWEEIISRYGIRVFSLDDTPLRAHSSIVTFHAGPWAKECESFWSPHTGWVLGGEDCSIVENRYLGSVRHPEWGSLLINLGGAKTESLLLSIIQSLAQLTDHFSSCTVVCCREDLEGVVLVDLAAKHKWLVLSGITNDFHQLVKNSQLVIGAGGVSALERAAIGVPSIIFKTSENQQAICDFLSSREDTEIIETSMMNNPETLTELLRNTLEKSKQNKSYSKDIFTPSGKEHIASIIMLSTESQLTIREVVSDDLEFLFALANDKNVRRSAFSEALITKDEHFHWFHQKLSDGTKILILETDCGVPLGQLRLDRVDGLTCKLDYSLAPYARGFGLGVRLISSGLSHLFSIGHTNRVIALVKTDNLASKKTLERCGFSYDVSINPEAFHMSVTNEHLTVDLKADLCRWDEYSHVCEEEGLIS